MTKDENEIYLKLGQLEGSYASIMKSLDSITNNHLAHIQLSLDENQKQHEKLSKDIVDATQLTNNSIDSVKIKIAYWLGGLTVLSFIASLLAQYFIRKY